ncbi:hypothetical protein ACMX2H_18745 [Arthrobacter sulfonylureivorans]|uniref:hypothetical protein n=1 Tax=Arthrobacter sulfonylureivorans TaxID=2486855 RepID=UPI0039E61BE5
MTENAGTRIIVGTPGLSAYQVAVAEGFVGTRAEWLASLNAEPKASAAAAQTSAAQAQEAATSAANDASAALQSAADAQASAADAAQIAADAAAPFTAAAELAATNAQASADTATAAIAEAVGYKDEALGYKDEALAAAADANASRTAAELSAEGAAAAVADGLAGVRQVLAVTSKAERDALEPYEGMIVIRLDQDGVIDRYIGGRWIDGDTGWITVQINEPFKHLGAETVQYRVRRGQEVSFRGRLAPDGMIANGNNDSVFQINPEHAPQRSYIGTLQSHQGTNRAFIMILSSGVAQVRTSTTLGAYYSFDEVEYSTN